MFKDPGGICWHFFPIQSRSGIQVIIRGKHPKSLESLIDTWISTVVYYAINTPLVTDRRPKISEFRETQNKPTSLIVCLLCKSLSHRCKLCPTAHSLIRKFLRREWLLLSTQRERKRGRRSGVVLNGQVNAGSMVLAKPCQSISKQN